MRPNDVRFLIAFNARMGMFIQPLSRETVVSFLHGYEAGTAGKCRFTDRLSEVLSQKHRHRRMAGGWPYQVEEFAKKRSLDWIQAYMLVSSDTLEGTLTPQSAKKKVSPGKDKKSTMQRGQP